jgi:hypothetical protein
MTHITNTDNPIDFPLSDLDKDSIDIYGSPLTGKYKHYCCEFDYLPIDENCIEFKFCDCFESSDELIKLRNAIILPE